MKSTYEAIYHPFFSAVDDLFKEANVKPNGIINYEEFTRMVTLPPVDYWTPSSNFTSTGGKLTLMKLIVTTWRNEKTLLNQMRSAIWYCRNWKLQMNESVMYVMVAECHSVPGKLCIESEYLPMSWQHAQLGTYLFESVKILFTTYCLGNNKKKL